MWETYISSMDLTGQVATYTMHNIPSYHPEPYINSPKNYMNWIGFQLRSFRSPLNNNYSIISSFGKLTNYLYDDLIFSSDLEDMPIPAKVWKSMLNDTMTERARAQVIFNFIRTNMAWNRMSGFKPTETNREIWKNKTASNAGINMLLVSALRHAGLKAYPMITASRTGGAVNTAYPILEDYHGLDALLVLSDGHNIVLDATNRYLLFGEPGMDQINTLGLVVNDRDHFSWAHIKDKTGSEEKTMINADVDENGKLTGTMHIVYTNHLAEHLIRLKNLGKEDALTDYLRKEMPNTTIVSVRDTIYPERGIFVHDLTFTSQCIIDNDGNIYLTLLSAFGDVSNPFINSERTADIDLGYNRKFIRTMQVHIPGSYTIDSVYPPVTLRMRDTSIVFQTGADILDHTAVINQKVEFFKSFYPASDYPAFYDYERKYYDLKQRPIMVRKKH